jgi:hypothetical protein
MKRERLYRISCEGQLERFLRLLGEVLVTPTDVIKVTDVVLKSKLIVSRSESDNCTELLVPLVGFQQTANSKQQTAASR